MNQSSDNSSSDHDAPINLIDIRHLSAEQFSNLGVSQLAYVKPVMLNGARAFAIHGADGTPMAMAGNEAVALAAIAQHEMVPARVH
jgi:hypothetical protein